MHLRTRGQGITLGLALAATGMVAIPALGANAAPAPNAEPSLVSQMRTAASGSLALRANPATGKVGFARAKGADPDLLPDIAAEGRQGAIDKAIAYIDRFAGVFGARADELAQGQVVAGKTGWTVTFNQSYRGVPVFAAELKAHVDREGDLTSVNGFAVPDLTLTTTPGISQAEASARALAAVKAKPSGYESGKGGHAKGLPADFAQDLETRSAELNIYRMGTTRGIAGEARLAWVVEVSNKSTVREMLVLDATTGKPLNRWSMIAHALDRELYEASTNNNGTPANPDDDFTEYDQAYTEGDDAAFDDLDEDQTNEVLGAGETYWMFRNTFGYNSWDGNGGKMITVNNDPSIDCPNANWNGYSTNYCTGVTGDDTVAHEWGHAYTESTSGLIYQWQAGAMNEAYSDIWGETVDMLNTRMNESEEEERTPGDCSIYSPTRARIQVTAPASIAGACTEVKASGGPDFPKDPTAVTLVVGVDAVEPGGGTATDGCSSFQNASAIAGNWVYVDENLETFCGVTTTYADFYDVIEQNAIDAGAVGLITGAWPGDSPWNMPGTFTIPAAQVATADGERFKSVMPNPVSIEVSETTNERDSYRWLSGESDPAFGGAIRDMWNPNCYGDPGQVSDEQYHCSDSDAGGVHTNSGVVNRTFAILVDGYPGVEAIGLDKAAWLFWHTQYNYLTPSSYFPDLADGLEASCEALKDVSFERVTLGSPEDDDGSDGGVIEPAVVEGGMTDADCNALSAAIAETELRLDPATQCNFQPLLKQGAPVLSCGTGTTTETAFSENFEDGLAGWSQDEVMVNADTETFPWEGVEDAPADHPGLAAYAPDPTSGVCDPDSPDDITSRSGLISPAITVPAGTTPRLSFDHYVATEAEWDGGNVKYSVGGGAFQEIPLANYVFNAPEGELDPEAGPMGGENVWMGTDGGQLGGSWGTTVVNLEGLATPGQSIKFRFDMGRDGCNGLDGWYVDNVKVAVCQPATTPTPTPTPGKADSTTTAKVSPKRPSFGNDFTVIGKVRAEGLAPRSRVIFKIDGKRIGSRKINEGRAVMTVRRNYGVGKHTLTVVYRGNSTVARSKDKLTFRIYR